MPRRRGAHSGPMRIDASVSLLELLPVFWPREGSLRIPGRDCRKVLLQSLLHIQNSQTLASAARYSAMAQAIHWTTAIVVVVAYIVSPGGTETRVYAAANDFSRGLHELVGLAVFFLSFARVCWRALFPPPPSPPMPAWMERAAKLGHWAIYVLLVLVPVTAILGAWFEGHPLTVLGAGNIAPPVPQARPVGLALADIHGWLGNVLIWLAGAHAVAALYHHVWRGDAVLMSMLPAAAESRLNRMSLRRRG